MNAVFPHRMIAAMQCIPCGKGIASDPFYTIVVRMKSDSSRSDDSSPLI